MLDEFHSVAVEDWLHELDLANGTKAKMRNIMSAAFRPAIRRGFLPREANPIKYVRRTAESDVVRAAAADAMWNRIVPFCSHGIVRSE